MVYNKEVIHVCPYGQAGLFLYDLEDILMSDTTQIQEQQPAPDFTLPAVGSDDVVKNGQVHLHELQGRPVVLYFYPKDDWTPVKIGVYVISIRG